LRAGILLETGVPVKPRLFIKIIKKITDSFWKIEAKRPL
jgi:hypothetical protein